MKSDDSDDEFHDAQSETMNSILNLSQIALENNIEISPVPNNDSDSQSNFKIPDDLKSVNDSLSEICVSKDSEVCFEKDEAHLAVTEPVKVDSPLIVEVSLKLEEPLPVEATLVDEKPLPVEATLVDEKPLPVKVTLVDEEQLTIKAPLAEKVLLTNSTVPGSQIDVKVRVPSPKEIKKEGEVIQDTAISWEKVGLNLPLKDFLALRNTSKYVHAILSEPSFVATWILHNALQDAFFKFSPLATLQVLEILISRNVLIPRYVVYQIQKQPLTEESKFILATGISMYGQLYNFNAEAAVHSALEKGLGTPSIIQTKIQQSHSALAWAYDLGNEIVTDADAFLYLMQLYRDVLKNGAHSENKNQSSPKTEARSEEFASTEKFRLSKQIAFDQKLANFGTSKTSVVDTKCQSIINALRELFTMFKFIPYVIEEQLDNGWIPFDLFHRDASLAWFLIENSGLGKSKIYSNDDDKDEVAFQTLLGHKIHISQSPVVNGISRSDPFPVDTIQQLISNNLLEISDRVILRMIREKNTPTVISRLLLLVDYSRVSAIGKQVLIECFEMKSFMPSIDPVQQASNLVKSFSLNLTEFAECFVASPKNKIYEVCDDIGFVTRHASVTGGLPWLYWQFALKLAGPHHLIATACLHDICIRSFDDSVSTYTRNECEKAIKVLIQADVRPAIATVVSILKKALYQIQVSAMSGKAAMAMKVQASKLTGSIGKTAAQVAQAAAVAGSNAVSKRYIYVMMEVERLLLTGADYQKETNIQVVDKDGVFVDLFPNTLLAQNSEVWLKMLQSVVVDNADWKSLNADASAPNACRRFYGAVSNIVRAMQQFGNPASGLTMLKSKQGNKSLKSMSSSESKETRLFGIWASEFDALDAEKERQIKKK